MRYQVKLILTVGILFLLFSVTEAQTPVFTFQGSLSLPRNGLQDIRLSLYDAETGGTLLAPTQTMMGVPVTNGSFSVHLDFGSEPFAAGADRWIEIESKRPSDSNYTIEP